MKSKIWLSTFRDIKQSLGRYLALMAIIALGVGFFAGLKVTDPAMRASMLDYLSQTQFYDYKLISTLGFEDEDIDYISENLDVRAVEASISFDIVADIDGSTEELKVISLPTDINIPVLVDGRLPENDNECVVDSYTYDESFIGKTIKLLDTNESEDLANFAYDEYTIVGRVKSPLYIQYERGTTTVGNGVLNGFIYANKAAFDCDYYTECYVKMDSDLALYSDEYKDLIDGYEDTVQEVLDEAATNRYDRIVADAQSEIDDAREKLDESKETLKAEMATAENQLASVAEQIEYYQNLKSELETAQAQLAAQIAQMEAALATDSSEVNPSDYEYAKQLYAANNSQLANVDAGLVVIQERYENALMEYEGGNAAIEDGFSESESKIADAEAEIADIKKPATYLLTRESNVGYVCFESDSTIVGAIANVFPVFFFLVAALVCMTTMNRMVEDQRTQIGILKALGYSNRQIKKKFTFYSGSAALVGAAVGFIGGTIIFPKAIWFAYQMMYNAGEIDYLFSMQMLVISFIVALACSVGVTYITCNYEMTSMAATLMRPKAPRAGKRILLEKIPFIWNKMKFLNKVSMRNIFRYKGRLFMMILGIGGCTALLVAGFGIYDSIADIAVNQYENISIHNIDIGLKDGALDEMEALSDLGYTSKDYMLFHQESVDVTANGKMKNMYLNVFNDDEDISPFFDMHSKEKEGLSLPGLNGCIINYGIANQYGIKVGDTLTISSETISKFSVKVVGINENFINNFIYINASTYEENTGQAPEMKNVYLNILDGEDEHEACAKLMEQDEILTVSSAADMLDRVNSMMESLNIIVYLVIGCAMALAIIVVYNLTNINISERIREIATVKVLGFYKGETRSYIFKENIILATMGAAVGLILGKMLHAFIMSEIVVDLITFDVRITSLSYLTSFLLTIVFTFIVNTMMGKKLDEVSMTESLKAVE